ncbi:MAG: ribonuclease D [Gemmatimonadales bacterium]
MTAERPWPGATDADAYIASEAGTAELFEGLRGETLLAVDTEAASFHRYLDRIYLIQVSSRGMTAIIDPLAMASLDPLGAALIDPAVEIVFHDADYDLRILDRDYGLRATNLFDTRIAAQLLNEPGLGLAALLEKHLGVRLNKKYQRADWSRRPLTPPMLEYAAADTRYLPELRDLLRERLDSAGRWAWAKEEFQLLEEVRWTPSGPPGEAYLRLKGAKALRGRSLLLLQELFAWREENARRLDRAPFRVLNNEALVAIAQAAPGDLAALGQVPGLSPETVSRRGDELLAAVARGVAAPPSAIPVFERSRRLPPDPVFDAALERLKTARNQAAERLDLAPGVLCPNGILEAIARARPSTVEEMKALPGVRRWQVNALGMDLLEALGEEKRSVGTE